jgi:hypothetical protein
MQLFDRQSRQRCKVEKARGKTDILHQSRAEPWHAGDGGQRPLVPRSRCQPRLTPSVRQTVYSTPDHAGILGQREWLENLLLRVQKMKFYSVRAGDVQFASVCIV